MMAGQAMTNSFWKQHNEGAWAMEMVYRGAGRICTKIGIFEKIAINKCFI